MRGIAADASNLEMFRDEEFDLVIACAALHHTMKYPGPVEDPSPAMPPAPLRVLCTPGAGSPPRTAPAPPTRTTTPPGSAG